MTAITLIAAVLAWTLTGRETDGPLVQVLSPQPGFKLRQGKSADVEIRVKAGTLPVESWRLSLVGPDSSQRELGQGSGEVEHQAVTAVAADTLQAGNTYQLLLRAEDTAGQVATAETTFRVPDPQYTLIPLESGNHSRNFLEGLSVDATGGLVTAGGEISFTGVEHIDVLDLRTGALRTITLAIAGSGVQKLARDGQRFFYHGSFVQPIAPVLGVGFVDLATEKQTLVGPNAQIFFDVSADGHRVAFQARPPSSGERKPLQYFLYDEAAGEIRQLTDDPNAIVYTNDACPRLRGTTPLLTADGSRVVLITGATLGLAPADPTIGCRVFTYDVADARLQYVTGLRREVSLGNPALSDDGRWVSFTSSRPGAGRPLFSFPALLDLATGELTDPLGGIGDFPSFDSVIAGDGRRAVISTQADVDARVGNADHNMELFVYDRETGEFTQVSETTDGIGVTPNHCESYLPAVSRNADVVALPFNLLSVEGCHLDGPQTSEVDGLRFTRAVAVRRRPGNHPPTWQPATAARIQAGETLEVSFAAGDPDNDWITFFAQTVGGLDVPPNSVIQDHRDGTATFRWKTRLEFAGVHRLRVAAFDGGGGEVFDDLRIAVCSRIETDSSLGAVLSDVFDASLPIQCRSTDVTGDGAVSAADVVASARTHKLLR